jgi:exodeoxyribonuclease VII small subunit
MSKKNLQTKLDELQRIVDEFNSPDIAIEKALERFDEGAKLASEIESDLAEIKTKVTLLKERFDVE